RSRFRQAACEQAAQSKATGVVLLENLLGLPGDVKSVAFLRIEKPVGVFDGTQHRLLMKIAGKFADGTALDELAIAFLASLEARAGHALWRADRSHRIGWIRQIERPVFAAEE